MYHKDHRGNPHAPLVITLIRLVLKLVLAVIKKNNAHGTSATPAERCQF